MVRKLSAIFLAGCGVALAQSNVDDVLLLSECSDSSPVRRIVQSADVVEVRHSLAGGAQTCYAVSITTVEGKVVEGFLLGAGHPAAIAFDRKEQVYIARALHQPPGTGRNLAKVSERPKH